MNNSLRHSQNGFTLLELTISIFLFSIIISSISSLFIFFINSYSFSFEQNLTLSEIKVAFSQITSELRETQASEDGSYPLFTADDSEVGFYADIDNDNRVEKVRYYLTGNTFYKGVIEPDDTLSPYTGSETITVVSDIVFNQGNPIFYYYNGDWPGDTVNNPLAIGQRLLNTRLIEVTLELNTAENQQENIEFSTQISLRNLKTNY